MVAQVGPALAARDRGTLSVPKGPDSFAESQGRGTIAWLAGADSDALAALCMTVLLMLLPSRPTSYPRRGMSETAVGYR